MMSRSSVGGVNHDPNPQTPQPSTDLPVLMFDDEIPIPSDMLQHKSNMYYPKRKYSAGADSLRERETPVFSKSDGRQKKGPSSPTTVLTMAGFFVCGLLLLISGIIVLCEQNETAFQIAGIVFVVSGSLMLVACVLLQRKNVVKYITDINRDLYFLNMNDSYMWKLMFRDEPSELPVQH